MCIEFYGPMMEVEKVPIKLVKIPSESIGSENCSYTRGYFLRGEFYKADEVALHPPYIF